jgi:hypothetical protein
MTADVDDIIDTPPDPVEALVVSSSPITSELGERGNNSQKDET